MNMKSSVSLEIMHFIDGDIDYLPFHSPMSKSYWYNNIE